METIWDKKGKKVVKPGRNSNGEAKPPLRTQPKDADAFEKDCLETHISLAGTVQGVRKIELSKVVGASNGSAPAYCCMAGLYFDDAEHMKRVMDTAEAKATVADLANFATGGVIVLISSVS